MNSTNQHNTSQEILNKKNPDVIIYTDGSCSPNPGKAGWAAVLINPTKNLTKEISGGFKHSTIGRMEIMAVINGLKNLTKDNLKVQIYSDAKYVVDSFNKKWVYKWENEFFANRLNADLWIELLKQIRRQEKVEFFWVKGHSGIEYNEKCDVLAYSATQEPNLPEDFGYTNPQPVDVPDLFAQKEEVASSTLGYELRQYQGRIIHKMEMFLNTDKADRGVFVLPTGAGKSIIIAELANRFPNKYFINVATSKELVKQNYEKFTSYGLKASLLSASWNRREVGEITFSTIGTLIKEVDFFKDKEVVIVADECHLSSQKYSQFDSFLKQLKKAKTVGLTATPFRLSNTLAGASLKMLNRDRNCLYKSIEDVVQVEEMLEGNYWSQLLYNVTDLDESSLVLNSSGSDYTEVSLEEYASSNNLHDLIVSAVKEQKDKRKAILVSVPSIKSAEQLADLIPNSRALHSKMKSKERDEIVEGFKSGKIQTVIQVRILTIGFDYPELDCIIMGTPTNSLVFHYQLCGRGCRIHPSKKDCLIIDFSGNTKRFGKVEDLKIINSPLTKGWAVIGADNKILTGHTLNIPSMTLDTLEMRAELLKENIFMKKDESFDAFFTFGKYNGSKVSQVVKSDFRYVKWLLENADFEWKGEGMKKLKESLILHVKKFTQKLAD